ncbi:MAG TPA: VOC family protein [Streptosporangiaceae bacterium]|jgi:catechol 2,3-dioxygenase-like lactoylglutathione lyase family enzyme|nr:VOC family protein [Streptosporangiaceae bacterium]
MNATNGQHAAILNITLDCADARAQASFWAAVLGWAAHEEHNEPGHVEYLVESPAGSFPRLYFTTVLDHQPPGAGWLILADPEGNEFCLEGAGPD